MNPEMCINVVQFALRVTLAGLLRKIVYNGWIIINEVLHFILTNQRSMGQTAFGCMTSPFNPRKKFFVSLIILCLISSFIMLFQATTSRIKREKITESQIALLKSKLMYLESQYTGKQEELYNIQTKAILSPSQDSCRSGALLRNDKCPEPSNCRSSTCRFTNDVFLKNKLGILINLTTGLQARNYGNDTNGYLKSDVSRTMAPEIVTLMKNVSGSRTAQGLMPHQTLETIKTPFSLRLMPHLMENSDSLKPAFHMQAGRSYVDVIIGVPTVKRDKESYLMITLGHLISGLEEEQKNKTVIVVFVGETDLEYVISVAHDIETAFPNHVNSGLIEVLSPHPSYYPDLEALPLTLGDSKKRVKWRTKQNLDAVYLMAYASSKGTFYLMIEDDVVSKKYYMTDILKFAASTTMSTPDWFFINFSTVGGIGKLFRSADLIRFITYVQIFYVNMPIDWLLESYLSDRICGIDKSSKACGGLKAKIRPTFKSSLFQHIGLYSSLKGKIQRVKDNRFGVMPLFFPHQNPELLKINCTIQEHGNNTLKKAYEGSSYFWGVLPTIGDVMEFWFKEPPYIKKYTFRTGNIEHTNDKLTKAAVEVLSAHPNNNFTVVGYFDEFGLAEGKIDTNLLPLLAIRVRVEEDSKFWVIISEIELKTE